MVLKIYTLKKPVIKKDVDLINLKSIVGELTILKNHRPYLTFLEKCKIRIIDKDKNTEYFEINGGILEVLPGSRVNILANL
jgi:F0F1-type ATP synthase epsilon subunit